MADIIHRCYDKLSAPGDQISFGSISSGLAGCNPCVLLMTAFPACVTVFVTACIIKYIQKPQTDWMKIAAGLVEIAVTNFARTMLPS